MKRLHQVAAATLLLLMAAAVYSFWRTREEPTLTPTVANRAKAPSPAPAATVDQSTLKTAQRLAQLANTNEERPIAQEALRLADYDIDLAFTAALQNAKEHPPALSPEAKEIQTRLQKAQKLLSADQARVAQLTDAAGKTKQGPKKDALDDDLANAKAQLELDQDEVDDAKQDLIHAGGDPEDRIQAMVKEHEAAAHDTATALPNPTSAPEQVGLIHRYTQWSALHNKQLQLWAAKSQAEATIATLMAKHNALDAQLDAEKLKSPHLAHHSKKAQTPEQTPEGLQQTSRDTLSHDQAAAQLAQTQRIAGDQKTLATYGKRMETQKELMDLYGQWIQFVQAKQRAILHRALIGVLIILVIALAGLYFSAVMDRLVARLHMDRRQVQSLRTVTRVTLQVGALLFILLVIFGPPGQLGTFLGLAGAGLTVALKDFIVGFIGWFVLMGKNGIRLGDWVEINGVTGEVVEIGPFHTVLLETGNWTDSGHPTGRRVTFTNSFAIEGHYFNFSTTGQWLWDELQVVLPTGQDPYPVIDAIQKRVTQATQANAQEAEQEWHSAAASRDMKGFSAAPAVSVKPVLGGIEVSVRYITRASERYTLRSKLNQAVVELLGGKPSPVSPAPVANA